MHPDEVLQVLGAGVVEGAAGVHPLDDGGHVAEDDGVHQGCRGDGGRKKVSTLECIWFSNKVAVEFFWSYYSHKARQVLPTSNQHGAYGEDLLRVRVGRDVAEAHAGQAAQSEVQRRHVGAPDGRAAAEDAPRAVGRPRSAPAAVPLGWTQQTGPVERLQARAIPLAVVGHLCCHGALG